MANEIDFSDSEIKALKECPEVMDILISYHDSSICEGEAMGFECGGNYRRIEELKKRKQQLEEEL